MLSIVAAIALATAPSDVWASPEIYKLPEIKRAKKGDVRTITLKDSDFQKIVEILMHYQQMHNLCQMHLDMGKKLYEEQLCRAEGGCK